MRILFIARISSPIAARWINQLADTGWDIHIYGTTTEIHPLIYQTENVTVYTQFPIHSLISRLVRTIWPFTRGSSRLKIVLSGVVSIFIPEPGKYIAELIKKLRPDLIHSLQLWNQGNYVLDAKKLIGNSLPCPWLHSVWGGDINPHFSPTTTQRIEDVLSNCDYLLAGSSFDMNRAYKHGFSGRDFGVIPSGGGWDIDGMRALIETASPSQRKIIAVKGYQTDKPGGKVLIALEALKLCGDILRDYKIVIHSAIGTYASKYLDDVRVAADEVSNHCNVAVEFLPLSPLEEIWRLFGKSRIALAISSADGIPNAMIEAMIMGAYPIQSDTGGLDVWIDQDINGSLVPYDEPQAIADAIRHAIADNDLVDRAAERNLEKTKSRIAYHAVRLQAIHVYKSILESSEQESKTY